MSAVPSAHCGADLDLLRSGPGALRLRPSGFLYALPASRSAAVGGGRFGVRRSLYVVVLHAMAIHDT